VGSNPTPRTKDEFYTLGIFEGLWQIRKDEYSENTLETFERRLRRAPEVTRAQKVLYKIIRYRIVLYRIKCGN